MNEELLLVRVSSATLLEAHNSGLHGGVLFPPIVRKGKKC